METWAAPSAAVVSKPTNFAKRRLWAAPKKYRQQRRVILEPEELAAGLSARALQILIYLKQSAHCLKGCRGLVVLTDAALQELCEELVLKPASLRRPLTELRAAGFVDRAEGVATVAPATVYKVKHTTGARRPAATVAPVQNCTPPPPQETQTQALVLSNLPSEESTEYLPLTNPLRDTGPIARAEDPKHTCRKCAPTQEAVHAAGLPKLLGAQLAHGLGAFAVSAERVPRITRELAEAFNPQKSRCETPQAADLLRFLLKRLPKLEQSWAPWRSQEKGARWNGCALQPDTPALSAHVEKQVTAPLRFLLEAWRYGPAPADLVPLRTAEADEEHEERPTESKPKRPAAVVNQPAPMPGYLDPEPEQEAPEKHEPEGSAAQ